VGRPAKPQRELTEQERAFFTYTAENYSRLKDKHRAEDWAQ
jgi:carbonic anhydrase/acetyltransferase-like protein (isoleucine patch superfamily)